MTQEALFITKDDMQITGMILLGETIITIDKRSSSFTLKGSVHYVKYSEDGSFKVVYETEIGFRTSEIAMWVSAFNSLTG